MLIDSSPELDDSDGHFHEHGISTRNTTPPVSLQASISPPPSRARRRKPLHSSHTNEQQTTTQPSNEHPTLELAAIEAGYTQITNHLAYFSAHLSSHIQPSQNPLLSMPAFRDLYRRNQHRHGRHWVIHQHDHPVAGVHYDLRLQINETSSISLAIMYGLPGWENSRRLNRNAIETRVHNVWNHLIETASTATGSLLIWDTGEYEILPWHETASNETEDERSGDSDTDVDSTSKLSDSEKLHIAFQNRKIRIRFNGARLPKDYTLSIRLLPSENRHAQPAKPPRKRRWKAMASTSFNPRQVTPLTSDQDDDEVVADVRPTSIDASASALKREIAEQEDEDVRRTNAYPGARNSIGSIHQRRWYLSMDRYASGYMPKRDDGRNCGRREWVRRREDGNLRGFEPFFLMGREVERSVVTGRNADEVMVDEGVEGFLGRKGWRAVTE